MDEIIQRVKEFIQTKQLIISGDIVGCGLSGGADSIFLTFVLNQLSVKMNFKIIGIHINHMLRGEEADRDEDFSKRFCEKFGIEFKSYKIDVLKYSEIKKLSTEMGGRDVRYGVFEDLKKTGVITKCATGHHLNDDVETIVMRIFRGTGIKGIEGIKEIRDDFYIRPLLFLKRSEIEDYLNKNSIGFITDNSNLTNDYLRNRVRNVIIPSINESFGMDITNNILNLKEISKCDNDFFDKLIDKYIKMYVKISNKSVCINKECFKLHNAILFRVIRESLFIFGGNLNNIGIDHIKYIINFSQKNSKTIQLKKNLYCLNFENEIRFVKCLEEKKEKERFKEEILNAYEIDCLKKGSLNTITKEVDFLGRRIKVVISRENSFEVNECEDYKYFSLDNVYSSVCIRNRVIGDRVKLFGMSHYKKLKDVLINQKIKEKDLVPIISFDNEIVWVVGVRNSEEHKVCNSKTIIKIRIFIGDN